ncbi:PAS domain S-box protein [Brevibacillus fluminis]|uniref:histidine kinase n=1 Tax=Brevibacillus fluminis TaxID=511487 RepID=A0A3M8DB31_9BACL|nr:ATP-binding protein [Brevibacillus fluminis]RNB85173.1 PAS domain S-box protein [Brevibacillus fluminis]
MKIKTYIVPLLVLLAYVASIHSVSFFISSVDGVENKAIAYVIEFLVMLLFTFLVIGLIGWGKKRYPRFFENQASACPFMNAEQSLAYLRTKAVLEITKEDYTNILRQQQGMTFKFVKVDGRFIHTLCDGRLLHKLGLTPEEVVGKELRDFYPEDMAKNKETYYQRAWDGEEDVVYEGCANDVVYLATLRPVIKNGEVVEVISSCVDITILKKTMQALNESEERFRQIAEHIEEVFWIVDPNTRKFLYLSPAYERVWGFSRKEFFRDPAKMFRVIHPDDRERIIQAQDDMQTGYFDHEYRIVRTDGTVRWIKDRGFPVYVDGVLHRIVGIAEDITDLRLNEELLIKSEKLAVLGELAAGIAHEIRNPLTSLRGFVQLMQKQQGQENRIYMDIMLSEINRINAIVGEFLVLAKPTVASFVSKDIHGILQQIVLLLEPDCLLHNITVEDALETEGMLIMCEENSLKQVFINILKNAIDSMPQGGEIRIESQEWEEGMLQITIIDNGCGISEERLRNIGEPFYTTKEKGTGLGLMVSYKIIQNHQGRIEIKSEVGKGTAVAIFLPFQRVQAIA